MSRKMYALSPDPFSTARSTAPSAARARAGLVWLLVVMVTGAVALAPVYLHLNGVAGLFSAHTAAAPDPAAHHPAAHDPAAHDPVAHDPVAHRPAVHADVHADVHAGHAAVPLRARPAPPTPDAPAPEHEGHAFCFFCVVLLTLQPSLVGPVRLGPANSPESALFGLEPRAKVYTEFGAQPRAPPF